MLRAAFRARENVQKHFLESETDQLPPFIWDKNAVENSPCFISFQVFNRGAVSAPFRQGICHGAPF